MEPTLENVLAEMAKIQVMIKDHQADPATIDMTALTAQFEGQMAAMVEKQVAEKLAAAPARRIPGGYVGAQEYPVQKGNRYFHMMKGFAQDGEYRIGTTKAKPIDIWLAHNLLTKAHALAPERAPLPSDDLEQALKAMDSTTATAGDELVPTNMADMLWQDFFLSSRVVGSLITIPMPSNPYDVPLGLGDPTWHKGSENTAVTASNMATAKATLTATELATEQNWSYTLEEDSIVAVMPAMREVLLRSGAETMDAFALNADATNAATGNINLDDADPADTKYYLSEGQDGIRHQWIVDNTAQTVNAGGDALIDGDVTSALALMGKYAADPTNCRIFTDVATYLKGFLNLDGVLTIDKFGPSAVLLTGQLAAYRGIPVIVSASHPLAEADGKVSTTAGNNTLGSISITNRLMWYLGFRRELMIEVFRDVSKRELVMVTSFREAIGTRGTRATNTHTAGIRNILVS